MNTKKTFKTKLSRAQKRWNIVYFVLLFAPTYLIMLFAMHLGELLDTQMGPSDTQADSVIGLFVYYVIYMPIAIIVIFSVLGWPVTVGAFILGTQKGKARRVRDDHTFIAAQGIEYYRELLNELNPSIVSILMDMDIETDKDISATLLRIYNKQHSSVELDNSEQTLLDIIKAGELHLSSKIDKWKSERFTEAEEMGLIERTTNERESFSKGAIRVFSGLIFMIGPFIIIGAFSGFEIIVSALSPFFFKEFFESRLIFAIIYGTINFLVNYRIGYEDGLKKRPDMNWQRTPKGHQIAEQIAGLAKFIREFSLLSQTEKERVVLWDDYLVYAVVLEENEKIVNDISKMCDVNLLKFTRQYVSQEPIFKDTV